MSSSTIFYVGEQPTDPFVVTVYEADGVTPRNLTGVSTIEIEAIAGTLPAGDTTVNNAVLGKVQYDFDEPFEIAEVLTLRVQLDTDYSSTFDWTVNDPADPATGIVTPAEVEAWTGISVSTVDISRAQALVSLAAGCDVSNEEWFAARSQSDQFWLRMATAYEAADLRSQADQTASVTVPIIPGATSIRNGDVAVTFDSGSDSVEGSMSYLSPKARAALSKLSWLGSMRTVHAKPFLGGRGPMPDPWVPMYRRVNY